MCCGVSTELSQGLEGGPGRFDHVPPLVQERPDHAVGAGYGADDDAEQLGEDAQGQAEACLQDGGQDHLGQGERGPVPAGGLAAGEAAAGDVQPGFAVGLVGDD